MKNLLEYNLMKSNNNYILNVWTQWRKLKKPKRFAIGLLSNYQVCKKLSPNIQEGYPTDGRLLLSSLEEDLKNKSFLKHKNYHKNLVSKDLAKKLNLLPIKRLQILLRKLKLLIVLLNIRRKLQMEYQYNWTSWDGVKNNKNSLKKEWENFLPQFQLS